MIHATKHTASSEANKRLHIFALFIDKRVMHACMQRGARWVIWTHDAWWVLMPTSTDKPTSIVALCGSFCPSVVVFLYMQAGQVPRRTGWIYIDSSHVTGKRDIERVDACMHRALLTKIFPWDELVWCFIDFCFQPRRLIFHCHCVWLLVSCICTQQNIKGSCTYIQQIDWMCELSHRST
jgi:hypothetical protein